MSKPVSFSLESQVALIIGGTSGIGQAIAKGFLQAGAQVVVAGRDKAKLERALKELTPFGPVSGHSADASDLAALRGLVGQVLALHGRIDILVNSQGVMAIKPVEDYSAEDWDHIVGTDLRSVFFACTEVGRHMLGRGSGAIINIGSLASHRGWPRNGLYGISKAGVLSLTRTLAAEWAGRGVRVNAISPGFVMTEMNRDKISPERKALALARTPAGRFGEVEDMVGAAIFLASSASSYVTGESIAVDGGFLATGM